jgi:hypothetical protein
MHPKRRIGAAQMIDRKDSCCSRDALDLGAKRLQ